MNIIPNYSAGALELMGIRRQQGSVPGQISMPDFSQMITKSEPEMSEEEYKEAIIQLAKKDAAEGRWAGGEKSAYMKLKKSFVSVASPDRRSIISGHLRKLQLCGNVRFAEFKDNNGSVVAHFSPQNGWRSIGTPEENRRESEFDALYVATWREAKNQASTPQNGFEARA